MLTQTDRGNSAFNFSKITGFAASTALSNVYDPPANRTASQNAAAYGITLGIHGRDCRGTYRQT
ncbi:MAG: hypothetical protein JWM54_1666 [Acidobacteriaceae bacterium]|nr:hypothetical protein [Acidobacteriaceae bacterium]